MESDKRKRQRRAKRTLLGVKKRELRRRIQEVWKPVYEHWVEWLVLRVVFNLLTVESGNCENGRSSKGVGISGKGHLTLEERQKMYMYRSQKLSYTEIGRRIGRDRSTVSREFKRNGPRGILHGLDIWSQAKYAHDQAQQKKPSRRLGKPRLKSCRMREFVEAGLKKGLSPELISERLLMETGEKISHEAIYQWIFNERKDLIQCLPRGQRKYHARTSVKGSRQRAKRQPAAPKTSIEKRPGYITERREFGHWEMDTIVSRQSKECLFVIQERLSRYFFVVKLKSCSAELVLEAVIKLLRPLGREWVKSITCDNGSENSCHAEISKEFGIPIYFCHPYCSSERGGVENRNGTLRRDYPKKTDFSKVANEDVASVREKWISRPMKCLHEFSPREIFTGQYQPIFKMAA